MVTRVIATVLFGMFVLYAGVCGALFLFQRSLLYFPTAGAEEEETAQLMAVRVAGEHIVASRVLGEGREAVVYFGGNAEDVSRSKGAIAMAFPGQAAFLLHYRGYGWSSGRPTEEALFRDSLALYDQVKEMYPRVAVVGRSLGSGLAVRVASRRQVERLVLVTPYDSMAEVAASTLPLLPARWLLMDRYESWRYAPQVTAPTVIVAAERDEVIPRASTERLRARFGPGLVRYVVVPGAGHNDVSWNDIRGAL